MQDISKMQDLIDETLDYMAQLEASLTTNSAQGSAINPRDWDWDLGFFIRIWNLGFFSQQLASLERISGSISLSQALASLEVIGGQI